MKHSYTILAITFFLFSYTDPQNSSSKKTCSQCSKQVLDLKRHIREVHRGVKPYQCTVCHKAFSRSHRLKVHTRSHAGEKPFECPYSTCSRRFVTRGDCKKHVNKHKGLKIRVKCPRCHKYLSSTSSLNTHLTTVHYNIRAYSCHICSATYKAKSELQNHIDNKHYGITYPCPDCHYPFSRPSSITAHKEKGRCPGQPVQPKTSAYHCPHCGRGFSREYSRKRHIDNGSCPNVPE